MASYYGKVTSNPLLLTHLGYPFADRHSAFLGEFLSLRAAVFTALEPLNASQLESQLAVSMGS